jgi:quercetin dioxygenase-like cupin family protein
MDGNRPDLIKSAVVMQPDDGPSYWCPVPANGYAHPKLVPADTGFDTLSMGFQTIAPGCYIREHSHDSQIELQIGFQGTGRVVVDGESHDIVPGTACFLGHDVKHEIHNETDNDLVMMWIIAPSGLEDFFAAIGRPRQPSEPTPEPFARPTDVVAIEKSLGMEDTGDLPEGVEIPEAILPNTRLDHLVGRAVVLQPGEGDSYWQPKPADGYADNIFLPGNTGFDGLTMGFQTIPPGRHIRDHAHDSEIEMHICMRGAGAIEVEGDRHRLVPGTACFVGHGVHHKVINEGDEDLMMAWVISPGGLDDHLSAIGKPRSPGESPPASFERPERV